VVVELKNKKDFKGKKKRRRRGSRARVERVFRVGRERRKSGLRKGSSAETTKTSSTLAKNLLGTKL